MSILGIDIGSTGCKAAAYTDDGRLIGHAYREYEARFSGRFAMLSPAVVWQSVKECIKEAASACEKDLIKALSVSSMSDTFTPIDKDGEPLCDSIMSFDSRASELVEEMKAVYDPHELYMLSGMPMHPLHPFFKIIWLKDNNPSLFNTTHKYLFYEDYILYKLGAQPSVSYSNAGRSMLFDYARTRWAKEQLSICGINESQLSDPYPSGAAVGQVSKSGSEETGLPKGVKLVVGGFDQACCAAACGVFKKGSVVDTTGTNEILFFVTDMSDREVLYEKHLSFSHHVYGDTFSSFGHIFNAGGALKWYRDLFYKKDMGYDEITDMMPEGPTAIFFLPFLSGIGTPEMLCDIRGAFFGLSLSTDRFEISKAILEGVTMEMRYNTSLIEDITGSHIDSVVSVGGASKSELWMQLKADITGKTIEGFEGIEPGCAGAAILAGVGAGLYSDAIEGYKTFSKHLKKKSYTPNIKNCQAYENRYKEYCELRSKLLYRSL